MLPNRYLFPTHDLSPNALLFAFISAKVMNYSDYIRSGISEQVFLSL